jgi:DNA (cytosine-5)-methyltransferase 1
MRVLDLYSCQGGAGAGYEQAGAEVTGVDLQPQPRYPFTFVQSDAIEYVRKHGREFDLIHASPPCQLDSDTQRLHSNDHPDLIGPTRDALNATGVPWVIENVRGALPKLRDPVRLCGAMFGLRTYRHRFFETGGWELEVPDHPWHKAPQAKMGRAPRDGEFIQAVGNFSGVELVRQDWGVPWMNRDGIREAIPPAYSKYILQQFTEWSRNHG